MRLSEFVQTLQEVAEGARALEGDPEVRFMLDGTEHLTIHGAQYSGPVVVVHVESAS